LRPFADFLEKICWVCKGLTEIVGVLVLGGGGNDAAAGEFGPRESAGVGIPEGDYEVVVVLHPLKKRKHRRAGFSKARFVMSPDFNAPLDDFKEYMG
jgi:hypothetical protein